MTSKYSNWRRKQNSYLNKDQLVNDRRWPKIKLQLHINNLTGVFTLEMISWEWGLIIALKDESDFYACFPVSWTSHNVNPH